MIPLAKQMPQMQSKIQPSDASGQPNPPRGHELADSAEIGGLRGLVDGLLEGGALGVLFADLLGYQLVVVQQLYVQGGRRAQEEQDCQAAVYHEEGQPQGLRWLVVQAAPLQAVAAWVCYVVED